MTQDASATPNRRTRGPKFPAAIPRTMTTENQRTGIEGYAAEHDLTLGEAVRDLIDCGFKYRNEWAR